MALSMSYTYLGDQHENYETLINTLASTEAELHQIYYTPICFCRKKAKNHKSIDSHPKNLFLPNKKYFSVVSDGISNLLRGGYLDEISILTSPLFKVLESR
ncbi:unnamed protein product [Meganyctiphanes norvegica]|uniref:Uncharacterized protein n=1 Tax=Meganyctiphanes norvegica TaxID=48144 RepID=A0AAV2SLY5_MEGNR